jgi:hypothetical protein
MIDGGGSAGRSSRNFDTANVSYSSVTFSPASAERRNRSVSRDRAKGSSKEAAFHFSTITGDDAPMPRTNRPGASSATVAACIASRPGPRV